MKFAPDGIPFRNLLSTENNIPFGILMRLYNTGGSNLFLLRELISCYIYREAKLYYILCYNFYIYLLLYLWCLCVYKIVKYREPHSNRDGNGIG